MSRKEDSLQTRERLLIAAFNNFYEFGFQSPSLEKISRSASVSRGAAYWHFENKSQIFKEVIKEVLSKIQLEKEKIIQNDQWDFQEKTARLIHVPTKHLKNFKFLQQSMQTLETEAEFSEVYQEIQASKLRLYQFFETGLLTIGCEASQASELASLFYTYFEGMYVSGIPKEVKPTYKLSVINNNLEIIFSQLKKIL
ncbi:TetR/AcrR family transcriptional regulator [Enterococcus alishanensis]|uniref:TetR/AcrR family transcriptional regulator n=1 Tax=Enterococcus alishanensis TaxID=1303817 RepID=A0ABS6TCU2_9ENTE|nr:TetR/AcrR family transcriptional regulator [Enterococcus alishanensis]MBV7390739.1 TetR/AcrR family transcriptional regulator [Enterococcus alishanensis]